MTIATLIDDVIGVIGRQFYCDQPLRNFQRDRKFLMQSVSRYGHECNRRGWDFDAPFIQTELLKILNEIKRTNPDIKWFPKYLEGAVDRSLRQRAEELSDRAKSIRPKVARLVAGCKLAVLIEQTDTEILAALYKDLRRQRPRRRGEPKHFKQEALL